MDFRPLSHECKQVGKLIKASKKKESWVFELKGQTYTVEYFSSLRGNRKLLVNGQVYPAEINHSLVKECTFVLAGETVELTNNMIGGNLYVGGLCFAEVYRNRYQAGYCSESVQGQSHWEQHWDAHADSWEDSEQKWSQESKKDAWVSADEVEERPAPKKVLEAKPAPKKQEIDLLSFEPDKPSAPLASLDMNHQRAAPPVYYAPVWQPPYPMYNPYAQAWRPNPY